MIYFNLLLLTEILDDRNYWVKCALLGTFGTFFVLRMEGQAVSGNKDVGKSIDNSKITGGIPPNFDEKVVSDEELVDFTIQVHNVKK